MPKFASTVNFSGATRISPGSLTREPLSNGKYINPKMITWDGEIKTNKSMSIFRTDLLTGCFGGLVGTIGGGVIGLLYGLKLKNSEIKKELEKMDKDYDLVAGDYREL